MGDYFAEFIPPQGRPVAGRRLGESTSDVKVPLKVHFKWVVAAVVVGAACWYGSKLHTKYTEAVSKSSKK